MALLVGFVFIKDSKYIGNRQSSTSGLLGGTLGERDEPYGSTWQRVDSSQPERAHQTWLLLNARVVLATGTVVLKGATNRTLSLPVRHNVNVRGVLESTNPPKCSCALAVGFLYSEGDNAIKDWNNFWHFNADEFFPVLHTLSGELAAGTIGPHGLPSIFLVDKGTKGEKALPFPRRYHFVREEVQEYFNPDISLIDAAAYGLTLLGEIRRLDEDRVICIDRLYVGGDRQCATHHDKPDDSISKAECHSHYKVLRNSVWRGLGVMDKAGEPLSQVAPVNSATRPSVVVVTRTSSERHGKAIINEADLEKSIESQFMTRFGVENYDFSREECQGFKHTVDWWTRATIIVMTRGACQANIPFGRDGSGLMWIDPCGLPEPQIYPMPKYLHYAVYGLPSPSANCNSEDFTVDVTAVMAKMDLLLDTVHPRM